MWPFSRELKKRRGQPFYWLYVLVSILCTAALVTAYAFTDRIVGLLPQATWFVVVFGIACFAVIAWVGRNDPALGWLCRWVRKRVSRS